MGVIDVNASLKDKSSYPTEDEIAFPGGVPNADIKSAWSVDHDGQFGTSSQLNTGYYVLGVSKKKSSW